MSIYVTYLLVSSRNGFFEPVHPTPDDLPGDSSRPDCRISPAAGHDLVIEMTSPLDRVPLLGDIPSSAANILP